MTSRIEFFILIALSLLIYYLYINNKSRQWRADRADGKFCKSCGAATYITKIRRGYDSETGKPILENYRDCPNTRYGYEVDEHPRSYDF